MIKLKNVIHKYREEIAIGIISLIAFIAGIMGIGFIKSFLIVGIADTIYVGSIIMNKKKKTKTKSNNKQNIKKNSNKKKIVIKILKGKISFHHFYYSCYYILEKNS